MDLLIAFASLFGAWFLVLTIPGPNFMAVTQISISASRKSGLYVTLGVSVGAATWATASLLGLSAVFDVPWFEDLFDQLQLAKKIVGFTSNDWKKRFIFSARPLYQLL